MYEIQWGDLSAEQFLNDYWQKKPLLIRQAFPNLDPLLEPDELAGLALEEEVESRLIRYNPLKSDYALQRGPLSEADFAQLPESHWTLLVQAVDHYVDEAAELLDCFNFIPRWRIDDLMISYATPGGGVGPHYDNYDVFLLQAGGTRRWEIGGIESSKSPRVEELPLMILRDFMATEVFELEPGDMLYLPPQVAHNGVATSADCLTYSIGFRAPSDAEMLRSFSDYIGESLSGEQRYSDPDLLIPGASGELDEASLQRVSDRLQRLLNQPETLASWFGQHVSEPKYPDDIYQPDVEEVEDWALEFDSALGVSLLPSARLFYMEKNGQLQLFCNATLVQTQGGNPEWIKKLCNSRSSGPISASPADMSLLKTLYALGAIE